MTAGAPGRPSRSASPRQDELLDRAYRHVLEHGLADMSLRPLAEAIGSSPRVLLFLFGSKDGLIRALLARAREDELAALELVRDDPGAVDLTSTAQLTWRWLAATEHRGLLALWVEAYARSLIDSTGPWAAFAAQTVADWLELLASNQPARRRRTRQGLAERTAVLALLRGAMLDLLATGDLDRTTAAVVAGLPALNAASSSSAPTAFRT